MKRASILLSSVAIPLAACESEPRNIQADAENQSQRLETRANEISAEADATTGEAALTLENQANALLEDAAPAGNDAEAANGAQAN